MRFGSFGIPAIFADGRTIVELKTITGAFDPFARARSGLTESRGFAKGRESDSTCWLLIGGQLGWREPILWTCGSGWLGLWRRARPAGRWPRRSWSASPAL